MFWPAVQTARTAAMPIFGPHRGMRAANGTGAMSEGGSIIPLASEFE